jgi:hypothetical protein
MNNKTNYQKHVIKTMIETNPELKNKIRYMIERKDAFYLKLDNNKDVANVVWTLWRSNIKEAVDLNSPKHQRIAEKRGSIKILKKDNEE